MPQMAPLNWLSLYLVFSIIFLTVVSIKFFMVNYKPKTDSSEKKSLKTNWKW